LDPHISSVAVNLRVSLFCYHVKPMVVFILTLLYRVVSSLRQGPFIRWVLSFP